MRCEKIARSGGTGDGNGDGEVPPPPPTRFGRHRSVKKLLKRCRGRRPQKFNDAEGRGRRKKLKVAKNNERRLVRKERERVRDQVVTKYMHQSDALVRGAHH